MEVVESKLRLHCKACERAVHKALCGITCVEIDVVSSKIIVMGHMDRRVVKAVQKTGRKAEVLSSPSSSSLSSPFYAREEQSARLPRGFR